VTHLVVRKGVLFKTDKVVPVSMVASTDADSVRLRPDVGDLSDLPDFEETHYVLAETGPQPEPARAMDEALANSPGAVGTRFGTAVGAGVVAPSLLWYPPAIGYNAYPPGPIPGAPRAIKTVDRNIPVNAVPLKEGAKVIAADDEGVGRVERVFVNSETKQATHLLLEHGTLAKTHKTVPVHWVDKLTEREVRLAVSSRLVDGLPEYKN
jgi:hypothetical protein